MNKPDNNSNDEVVRAKSPDDMPYDKASFERVKQFRQSADLLAKAKPRR